MWWRIGLIVLFVLATGGIILWFIYMMVSLNGLVEEINQKLFTIIKILDRKKKPKGNKEDKKEKQSIDGL